jgi:alanyl-tRNA synthetase
MVSIRGTLVGELLVIRFDSTNRMSTTHPPSGTHWASLAPVGVIHVLEETSAIRGTNARVYFLCGGRVLEVMKEQESRVKEASREVGAGGQEMVERVRGLVVQSKERGRMDKKVG